MKTYNKRLYRSDDNKIIFGIMGGLGEYFEVDPVLLRVGYILLSVFTAIIPGVIAYLLMALIIPKNLIITHKEDNKETSDQQKTE